MLKYLRNKSVQSIKKFALLMQLCIAVSVLESFQCSLTSPVSGECVSPLIGIVGLMHDALQTYGCFLNERETISALCTLPNSCHLVFS